MISKKKKPDTNKLSSQELKDLTLHCGERLGHELERTLQLVGDPVQRAALMVNVAYASLALATEAASAAYKIETGRTANRGNIITKLVADFLTIEGVEFSMRKRQRKAA
ncbi:hypothetical protein ABID65_006666 [Bradyrhizobium sp. S3.9.2]|uniref:hypothetical protein n=1 Tax=Bradyrhizobium sp. S3.9.2 TaxID=3156432 RepID=UPI0033976829